MCVVVVSEDMYAEDSIELLKNSGIDFHKHEVREAPPTTYHPYNRPGERLSCFLPRFLWCAGGGCVLLSINQRHGIDVQRFGELMMTSGTTRRRPHPHGQQHPDCKRRRKGRLIVWMDGWLAVCGGWVDWLSLRAGADGQRAVDQLPLGIRLRLPAQAAHLPG